MDNHAFRASDYLNDNKFHLLLAASGSVATIKLPNIIQGLAEHSDISIRLVLTRSAREFLQGQSYEQPSLETVAKYPSVDGIHLDEDEWNPRWTRGAPILHIELRRWADALVVAPLSANTLGKIANGLCDNLLTSVVRAWEVIRGQSIDFDEANSGTGSMPYSSKPHQKQIIVAPAMNTEMWWNPFTEDHLVVLGQGSRRQYIEVLRPIEKTIACGDIGTGAMCEWTVIVSRILIEKERFQNRQ